MAEIGATLREARQRRKVDLLEVETETKIRARYLRALEEEEFDLLPGPTYVKTFLRTYGEYLGVDAKLLVEEYKQRYERPTAQELTPFSTNLGSRRERRRARGPILSPGLIVGICIVLLLAILAGVGLLWPTSGKDDENAAAPSPPAASPTPSSSSSAAARRRRTAARGKREAAERRRRAAAARRPVAFQVLPEGAVYVCLVSGTGTRLIDKATLAAGIPSRRFRGQRFRVTFGNGDVRMRVGRKTYAVPTTTDPIGYDIRSGQAPRRLPASERPTCA